MIKYQVSFDVSSDDAELIQRIAGRFLELARTKGSPRLTYNRRTVEMDLAACHANGTPLDLVTLLSAPEFDFVHDLIGITTHIDRTTGKLGGLFLPRYAMRPGSTTGPLYKTLRAFYNDVPERWPSPEADYGVNWYDGRRQRWRVSYLRDTGEVYAVREVKADVRILGVVPPDPSHKINGHDKNHWYATLDRILEGWPDHCSDPDGLEWVAQKIAEATKK